LIKKELSIKKLEERDAILLRSENLPCKTFLREIKRMLELRAGRIQYIPVEGLSGKVLLFLNTQLLKC